MLLRVRITACGVDSVLLQSTENAAALLRLDGAAPPTPLHQKSAVVVKVQEGQGFRFRSGSREVKGKVWVCSTAWTTTSLSAIEHCWGLDAQPAVQTPLRRRACDVVLDLDPKLSTRACPKRDAAREPRISLTVDGARVVR